MMTFPINMESHKIRVPVTTNQIIIIPIVVGLYPMKTTINHHY